MTHIHSHLKEDKIVIANTSFNVRSCVNNNYYPRLRTVAYGEKVTSKKKTKI
jgi:hypothetical protein